MKDTYNLQNLLSALFYVLSTGHGLDDGTTKGRILSAVRNLGNADHLAVAADVLALHGLDDEDAHVRSIANSLRRELHALESPRVEIAVLTIVYWHLYTGSAKLLPTPPRYLLDDLLAHAQSRRQPGLTYVLRELATVVKFMPSAVDEQRAETLQRALMYMRLDATAELESTDDADARHQRVTYRYLAESLAASFFKLLRDRGQPIPDDIERWRQEGQCSPFPEFRRLWRSL